MAYNHNAFALVSRLPCTAVHGRTQASRITGAAVLHHTGYYATQQYDTRINSLI